MVCAIVQARLGSSRLPGKVLTNLGGRPLLAHVLERVAGASLVDKIVVATTTDSSDDPLERYLKRESICEIYRGSVDDVLDRFTKCAAIHGADLVVRITADDPLKDPEIIDHAVRMTLSDPMIDYCSNTIDPTYPEGLDVEVITISALEQANAEAVLVSDREHVTPYIWKRPDSFKLLSFKMDENLSSWRWTVDRPEDIDFMECVINHFKDEPGVSFHTVIDWLKENPEIRKINSGIPRNEGYQRSLRNE